MNVILTNKSIIQIAFLGPQGSYSHAAAIQYIHKHFFNFHQIIEYSCKNFIDIVKMVENHQAEYGILPLENSNSGLINEVCYLLLSTKVLVVGEITIPIKHCILVNHYTSTINQIQIIYSHPQPIQQCSKFLQHFSSWKIIPCTSSAIAIQTVAALHQSHSAALGSVQGGILYGLHPILSNNLSNQSKNTTRFIILKNIEKINIYTNKKIMLIMLIDRLSNKINTILKILQFYNIKTTYLKSKMFYLTLKNIVILEIIAQLHEKNTQQALIQLRKNSIFLKILNCCPHNFNNMSKN